MEVRKIAIVDPEKSIYSVVTATKIVAAIRIATKIVAIIRTATISFLFFWEKSLWWMSVHH